MARRRSVARSARRQTDWGQGAGQFTAATLTLTSSGATLMDTGTLFSVDGLTVARIRGHLELVLTTASAVGNGYTGAIGIGVVTSPAFP